MQQFTPDFFKNNRKELLQRTDTKLIVVAANAELQRSGDTPFPFRQDSNFWYLTGINEPNYVLVISPKATFLIRPNRHWVKDIFDGVVTDAELMKLSGIEKIVDARKGWLKLTQLLNDTKQVATLFPMVDRHFNITANPARRQLIQKMRRRVPALHMDDIRLELARMRMIKQEPEIAAIQAAIDATNQTLKQVFKTKWQKQYTYAYEIEADVNAGFRKNGAEGVAFPTIIGIGKDTCQIHPTKNNSKLTKGELLLFDLGAEYNNYSADISRTLPISAKMTKRQREVFEGVEEVTDYALSILKPGILVREYEKQIEEYMGTVLKNLGLIKRLNRRNIRKFFPHATSHSLGLDTHDAADYSVLLAENMILTVEPGIYIAKENIGIRIEDDYIITKDGVRNLSSDLPRDFGSTTM
jgi:Xaa-Pro aminopeptidase